MSTSRNPPASQPFQHVAAPSWQARLFGASLRYLVKPVFTADVPLPWQRRYLYLLRFTLVGPGGVRRESLELGGIPTVKFTPDGGTRNGSILYWHGGGYSIGSPATHQALASHLCKATQRAVYVPRYRLAPEHPYPAQLQDAGLAWAALYRRGVRPSDLVIVGDSAGGNLALSMLLDGNNAGLPRPAALVLISPWVDPLAAVEDDGRDALVSTRWVDQLRSAFLPDGVRRDYLSIPQADLGDLPPTLIQCAAVELLAPQARLLATRLRECGVRVTLDEAPGLWHDYQMHAGLVPEATLAVRRIADFLEEFTGPTQATTGG